LSTGSQNIAIGFQAGDKITSGTANVIIGTQVASTTLATGTANILIGAGSNCDTVAAGTNRAFMVCAATGSTPLMVGDTTAASLSLTVNGAFTAVSYTAGASAGIDCASGVTAGTVVVVKGIVTHC
jgi:hypothetical protein